MARNAVSSPEERDTPPSFPDWRTVLRKAAPHLGLGLQLAVTMLFFIGVGYLADQWLRTLPWLTLVGAVAGMAILLVFLVHTSRSMNGSSSDDTSS